MTWRLVVALVLSAIGSAAEAGSVHVAVAANFAEPAHEIAAAFSGATGHEVILSTGSTGQIYAQATQGAPFEIFLAADQARPQQAVDADLAVAGSRFTYAVGRLVLWRADPGRYVGPQTLEQGDFERLAIANPETAPYGAAAMDVLRALGIDKALAGKLVRGNSIAQAYQFVVTGNAELGFVAGSQVRDETSGWLVPDELHAPIAQDAVLLMTGAGNPAAQEFLAYLQGADAQALILAFGYGIPD